MISFRLNYSFISQINKLVACSHPDHVMQAVNVTVTDVDSNRSEGEAVLLPGAVDGDGRVQDVHCGAEVSAGRRVAR